MHEVQGVIRAAEAAEKLTKMVEIPTIPSRESHVRPLLSLDSDADRAAVWMRVLDKHPNGRGITAKDVEAERELFEAAKAKNWLTLDEWSALPEDERARTLRALVPDRRRPDPTICWI